MALFNVIYNVYRLLHGNFYIVSYISPRSLIYDDQGILRQLFLCQVDVYVLFDFILGDRSYTTHTELYVIVANG